MSRTYSTPLPLPTFAQATPENPGIERLMTVAEAGRYLRIGPRPIYRAIAEGRLAAAWVGRSWLVREGNLVAFIKAAEQEPSARQKAGAEK